MPHKRKEAKKAYYQANKEKLAVKHKVWREANKEKLAAYHKGYYQDNKEKYIAYHKAYYQDNKEKAATREKAYREANKEKINAREKAYYQANKEKIATREKAYKNANKEKSNERQAKRKALKLNQIPVHLRDCPKEKERLQQTYKLCHLFTKATGVLHHVDHMWPLSKGGPHWSGNLQIITAKENLSKGYKINEDVKNTIQEMLEEEEKLHKQKDEQDA